MSSQGTTREPSPFGETPKPMPSPGTTGVTPISLLSTMEETPASTETAPTVSMGETPRPMSSNSPGLVLTETTTLGLTLGGSETPMSMTGNPIQTLETPMTGTSFPMLETPMRM